MPFEAGGMREVTSGRHWDRKQLWSEVARRQARNIAAGVIPGDRVMLLADNTLEFIAELLAAWRCGACACPADAGLTPFELGNLAAAAEPRIIVVTGKGNTPEKSNAPIIGTSDAPATDAIFPSRMRHDDDALILFTSGSTGQPKGVVHTHRSLMARWYSLRAALGVETYERTLCLLPMFFGHGLICNSLFPLLSGCELHLGPAFTPQVLAGIGRYIDAHRITALSSVPALWRVALRIASAPKGGSLKRMHCGSAPLSRDLWLKAQEWGSAPLVNTYGLTETASWVGGSLGCGEPADGLIGRGWSGEFRVFRSLEPAGPVEEIECARGETGYVFMQTPALMRGYYRRDDLTNAVVRAGWLYSGDMGSIDDRGMLTLGGRAIDEINKGGLKVQPQDIENVATSFPGLTDACAFPFEDALFGQNIGVALVFAEGAPESIAALYAHMESHLSKHKIPARWYALDALPRTNRGKIHRPTVASVCAGMTPLDIRGGSK